MGRWYGEGYLGGPKRENISTDHHALLLRGLNVDRVTKTSSTSAPGAGGRLCGLPLHSYPAIPVLGAALPSHGHSQRGSELGADSLKEAVRTGLQEL